MMTPEGCPLTSEVHHSHVYTVDMHTSTRIPIHHTPYTGRISRLKPSWATLDVQPASAAEPVHVSKEKIKSYEHDCYS